jgi:hypothetical protein
LPQKASTKSKVNIAKNLQLSLQDVTKQIFWILLELAVLLGKLTVLLFVEEDIVLLLHSGVVENR